MDGNPGFQFEPGTRSSLAEDVALCDFLVLLRADESAGRTRSLADYMGRFPGLEVSIAREYLARLDGRSAPRPGPAPDSAPRYVPGPVIGRGGMGEVRRARDVRLDRELAMKTLCRPGERARERFLREACVTGRLDHPGVVPVHDLGVDADGQPFFTMKHVEGVDLDEVIERVRRGEADWSLARALEILIRVCDTMAFAHSRGIVHRDLKPSNVRVGRFGEVFVMDWGVARVAAEPGGEALAEEGGASPLADPLPLTLDGDVLGTPAYMAPEQAEGRNAAVGPAVDVYAVGALLYQLLSGRRPYGAGRAQAHADVLELVRTRAPESLRTVAARAPAELVAICGKAMQRRPEQRYATMEALARDLRAFLDRRLVSAHHTSALQRALKWTRRNRALVVPVAVVLLVTGIAALFVRHSRLEGRERLLQLSRSELVTAFDTFWPPSRANRGPLAQWLQQAEEVLATRPRDLAALEDLKRAALPMDPDAPAERAWRTALVDRIRYREGLIRYYGALFDRIQRGESAPPEGRTAEWVGSQVGSNQKQMEEERVQQPPHLTFRFEHESDQILFEALTLLVSEQEKLLGTDRPFGLVDLARWGIAAADRIEAASDADAWEQARKSIADRDECPFYDGFELAPQPGLVPIGRDPRSGLWEFAHVLSGDVPERRADGNLILDERSAIVLVLVPGGTLIRGAQPDDPALRNFDPWAESSCGPPDEAELAPCFLSKYELTQAQWERVTGRNPSEHQPAEGAPGRLLHPVENVALDDAARFLRVLGLVLPTEAQWEWALRAGTSTPWACGSAPESVEGYANVVGASVVRSEGTYTNDDGLLLGFDDGFDVHAPVGSFLPNAYGFHDMMGNVREWCGDKGQFEYRYGLTHVETGERLLRDGGTRAVRGGSFNQSVLSCRSAARDQVGPLLHTGDIGIRPARNVDR